MAFAGIVHIHSTQKDIQKQMDDMQRDNTTKQDTVEEVERIMKRILDEIKQDKH